EHTLAATRAAKREHVGASADLDSVVSEISQQVRSLDGLVRYRFGGNAELMGAWASARNVAGPFRSHGAPAAGGVTPGHQAGGVSPQERRGGWRVTCRAFLLSYRGQYGRGEGVPTFQTALQICGRPCPSS